MKVRITVTAGPDQGKAFVFDSRDRFFVGRASDCHLCIRKDGFFSRHHFMVEVNPPNVFLRDMNSTNGTYLNDGAERVREADVRHGDRIRGGETMLRVDVDDRVEGPVDSDADTVPPTQLAPRPGQSPSPSLDLDQLLGPAAARPGDRADVRCLRCGARAPNEQPRSRAENMAWFCDPCQAALRHAPVVLPGYQIVKELGCGGMGCVYLAVHQIMGRKCAIKQILPRAAMSEKLRKSFLREAVEQARLNHPRIVQVFEFQEASPGIFCMIMEFVDGVSADKLLARAPTRRLDPRLAVTIIAQALEALHYAHEQKTVHRDIKDANILVGQGPGGEVAVKLADFGLAKSYEESGASGFTKTGEIGGTIPYMAPEQIVNFKHVRPAADLYSMGATLYRLLTGAFPHDFGPGLDALLVVLENPIVPLRQRAPEVSPALAAAVEKALEKDPARRYRTAEEMRRALLAV